MLSNNAIYWRRSPSSLLPNVHFLAALAAFSAICVVWHDRAHYAAQPITSIGPFSYFRQRRSYVGVIHLAFRSIQFESN